MKVTYNVLSQVSLATLAACALLGSGQIQAASAADNLIINGSFESGTNLKDGSWGTYNSITGWQATAGGKIEVQRGAAGKAYDGKNLVELDSHFYNPNIKTLGLFQDIKTTIGKTYDFSFAYSARPGVVAADNIFQVLAGNVFKQTIEAGKGKSQTDWNIFSTRFVANSDTTRIQFNDAGVRNTTLGAYIDDVKAQAVPEPTAMLGLAIAGVGFAMRKKRQPSEA